MTEPLSTTKNDNTGIILWIISIIALIILGGGAFSRGLYFFQEFLVVNAIIGLLSLVVFPILLGNRHFNVDLLDGFVLAIGLAYTISIFGAASVGDAILEAMRVWTYGMFYFILSRSLRNRQIINLYSAGLIIIGVLLALWGLMTVPGWVTYAGSWTDTLSSTLQYHNAFASFLVGVMILAVYYWIKENTWLQDCLLGIGIFLMAIALAGSQSRGGYLIFLAAILVMLLIYPSGQRKRLVFPVVNFFIGLLLWSRFLAAANAKSTGLAIVWLLIGCVLSLVLTVAKKYSFNWEAKASIKSVNILYVVIGIVVIGTGVFALIRYGGDVLTTIKNINLQTHNVQERFVFYANAWEMFLKRPFLGYGGGGWSAAYKGFQSYLYYSNETHSIITKILVETGILGILITLGLIVSVIYTVFKSNNILKAKAPENSNRVFNLVVFLSFLAIGGHALIDFDLSEGALSLLLWGIIALLKAINIYAINLENKEQEQRPEPDTNKINNKLGFPVMLFLTIMAAVMLVAPFFIWNGVKKSQAADLDLQKRNYNQAVVDSSAAIRSFPFYANAWVDAAQANMYVLMAKGDSGSGKTALADINRASEINAFNPDLQTVRAGILSALGQDQESYDLGKNIISLEPFYNKSYESFGQIALQYGLTELQAGNKEKAKEAVAEAAAIPQTVETKITNLQPYYKNLWTVPEKLEVTPAMRLLADQAELMLGNLKVEDDLESLQADKTVGPQAKMWLAGLAAKNGDRAALTRFSVGLTGQLQSNIPYVANTIGALK